MNICYINPTNNIRRPIAELANILAEEGNSRSSNNRIKNSIDSNNNISIMFPVSKDCPTKNWVANDAIYNGKIHLIPIPSWYFSPLRYSFPNIWRLWKETKKAYQKNDIIHIWEYFYPLSVIPLVYASFTKKRKSKTILTTDGFVGYSYKPKQPWWLVPVFRCYTALVARFLFTIPKTITTYGTSMLPYAKQAGVPMSRMEVLPTGIHLERFQNIKKENIDAIKKELAIANEKVILFVGMLTERKGVDIVIKVSQQLLEEGYAIKTLIVGDAHGNNPYPNMVKKEWKDKIIFTGGRKDIPELMHLADVLLLPSEGEGLPGVVMEAMAAGLPVVATNEGCTPDLIEDGKEGFLVKEKKEYLHKVKEILDHPELSRLCKTQAKKKIAQFSWKSVAQKYRQLYESIS